MDHKFKTVAAFSAILSLSILLGFVGGSFPQRLTGQVVEGFSSIVSFANGGNPYDTCRKEQQTSWWEYDDGRQAVEWKTAPVPKEYTSGRVIFVWSCGMTARKAIEVPHHIYLNDEKILTFTTPIQDRRYQRDKSWRSGEYELFYDYAAVNQFADSFGVMYLTVPATALTPGRPAALKVVGSASGFGSFFMLTGYTDTIEWLRENYGGGLIPGEGEVSDDELEVLTRESKVENEEVRFSAAQDLIRFGDRSGIPVLIGVLKSGGVEIRRAAARDLGLVQDKSSASALMEAMKDEDEGVRQLAGEALAKINPDLATSVHAEALEDYNPEIRRSAVEALGRLGRGSAVPALIKALGDKDDGVRLLTISALGDIGDTTAVPAFVEAFQSENRDLRLAAVRALRNIGSKATMSLFVEALKDEDREIRLLSARALWKLGDRLAVPALVEALRDEYVWVRDSAIYALGEIGDRSSVPALIETLGDENEFVRKAAAAALRTITDQTSFGQDQEKWCKWWEIKGKHYEGFQRSQQ